AEKEIRDGVSFRGTNIVILVIAILIASLGLNTNSTAVIIGAMLISPLMGPIIGLGLGVGIQDFELLKRSLRNLAMAAGFSVIASTVYFLISPVSEGHSELLARTSPTIYDVFIGFFGGAAGIIAIGSRSKGNVIPGVAIATALMPPLCTAGYGLATMQLNYFIGAFYLFLINSIYIALATFIGVKLMNYKAAASVNPIRARKVRRTVYTIAILTLLPSIYLTYTMLRESRFVMNADRFVNAEFDIPGTHVLSYSASLTHGNRVINVTLIGRPLPTDSLELAMNSKLRFYGLSGSTLNMGQGSAAQSELDLSRTQYGTYMKWPRLRSHPNRL
ncbi:MAG: TIGR00341 family protein, partial [Muribaculaceae bacterium]|nr:TIGR00341 family protein [Muribaculaceae bacterium]